MLRKHPICAIWLILMSLTIASALIAESAEPSLLVTVAIAVSIGLKGLMVIDRFMELHNANRYIRNLMMAYFYVIPTLIVLVFLFPEPLRRLTTLD
jgi:hypothetical protein